MISCDIILWGVTPLFIMIQRVAYITFCYAGNRKGVPNSFNWLWQFCCPPHVSINNICSLINAHVKTQAMNFSKCTNLKIKRRDCDQTVDLMVRILHQLHVCFFMWYFSQCRNFILCLILFSIQELNNDRCTLTNIYYWLVF